MKKRNLILIAALVLALVLSACGETAAEPAATQAPVAQPETTSETPPEPAAETTVLSLGTTVNETDSVYIAAKKLADLISERTDGAYTIDIFLNAALGDERTMLESMQIATQDMAILTSGPFVNFVPQFGVFDMPFLFGSSEDAYKILDGEIGQEILDMLEGVGLKGLAYAEKGFRHLTNNVRPVTTVEDMAGLKIRVMENDVYLNTFRALGANSVPMSWPEVMTALQQGTIDGEENPINVISSYSLWETQKYCTLTCHTYSAAIVTMSGDVYNSLPADIQQIFLECAQEAAAYERQWSQDNEASMLANMREHGMEIIEEPELDGFREAVQSVYDSYPEYSDYLARIRAALD